MIYALEKQLLKCVVNLVVSQVDVHPITKESWLDVITVNKNAELSLSLISLTTRRFAKNWLQLF